METYTGGTAQTFKERWRGHKTDLRHKRRETSTTLSKYVWELKDEGKEFNIKWSLVDRAPPFNPITRKCRVCLKEKREILYNKDGSSLNKRGEIFNTCRHRIKGLLCNVKV